MTQIAFIDYAPMPRPADAEPWVSARHEFSTSPDGPWAADQALVSFAGDLDDDPTAPKLRSWTLETNQAAGLWWRVIFIDESGDSSEPTAPRHHVANLTFPGPADVAKHLKFRTYDQGNNYRGNFVSGPRGTKPQPQEVVDAISEAADDLIADLGTDIPEVAAPAVRALTALGAAIIIERSHFPGDIATRQSPHDALVAAYDKRLPSVREAIAEALADGTIDPTSPGGGTGGGGGTTPSLQAVVGPGSRIWTGAGWVNQGDAVGTFPDDGDSITYGTRF